jgi:hypothetical protein
MSPVAALGFVLLSSAFLMMGMAARRQVLVAQGMLLSVVVMVGFALVGYFYSATFFYQPTRFIRISPYAAVGQALLSYRGADASSGHRHRARSF